MNTHRILLLLLLLGLTVPYLAARLRPPTPLELALRRQVLADFQAKGRILPQVYETTPGVLEVYIPARDEKAAEFAVEFMPVSVTEIWRLQPTTLNQLEIIVHPFQETPEFGTHEFAGARWLGRRQGQLCRWERSTCQGPEVQVLALWIICDRNRERVKDQVLQTIQESGFGACGSDQIGWFGGGNCNSKDLIRAGQFRPELLFEQLDAASSTLDLRLYLGPGND